jgi:hypothetical protein
MRTTKKTKLVRFPTSVSINPNTDLTDWGTARIYQVMKDEAVEISKEFGLPTDFKKRRDDDEYDFFYLNWEEGKAHIVFMLDRARCAELRAKREG